MVTGRMSEVSGEHARVELGDGINAACRISAVNPAKGLVEDATQSASKPDLSSLSSKLKAHWKGGTAGGGSNPEEVRAGQIRSFRIRKLDPAAKKIKL